MKGKIRRSTEPEALEFPFDELALFTPNDLFYVRNHFPSPQIDASSWSLSLDGCFERQVQIGYEEILAMPSSTVDVTLECAGNSRTFLSPPVKGVQWDLGGISSARWTGVPLADIVEKAGLQSEAVDLLFEGADCGEIADGPRPTGNIRFARSLPVSKASNRDILLAYQMNGEKLTPDHGFPLRLIVPGWYAVSSVKWLTRIAAIDHQFQGYFQSIDYAFWDRSDGQPQRKAITEMQVKSQISSPRTAESLPAGSSCLVRGAAWSGAANIARVEVSTDDGATWDAAEITSEKNYGLWSLWQYQWKIPSIPGERILLARATDEKGNTQPVCHDPDRETYMINFCLPIKVLVS